MLQLIIRNMGMALEGISQNKLRSFLTALGIIFGVFAVISMLAIGNGAKRSIMDQLKLIGTNNIVITPIKPGEEGSNEEASEEEASQDKEEKKSFTPGLSINDVRSIQNLLPNEESISLETFKETKVIYGKNSAKTNCTGVNKDFFEVNNLELRYGRNFSDYQSKNGLNVCILGANISKKLFLGKNPIGSYVKCNHVILKVVGVLEPRVVSKESYNKLGISNYGNGIFIPIETFFLRVENRKKLDENDVSRNRRDKRVKNYHQLDKVIVKVQNAENVEKTAIVIDKLLTRRHNNQKDFEIDIPELLIKQQQKTQETLNFILAIIAGISLLVGGIGIMNIMLASVLERIREIGLRRSVGATREDVIIQFLLEAVSISLTGGIIGIILGVIGAKILGWYADIPTVISFWSVFISFFIAFSVGLIFGIMPARKAADMDPITALRTD